MKTCSKCLDSKLSTDFYVDKQKSDGLTSRCKTCIKPANNLYSKENRASRNLYSKSHYVRNRGLRLEQNSIWAKNNRDKKNAHWRKRQEMKLNQTPEMFDDEKRLIESLYLKSKKLTRETGVLHHVDHIVPISMGGPHCYLNLQILTAAENRAKGSGMVGVLSN